MEPEKDGQKTPAPAESEANDKVEIAAEVAEAEAEIANDFGEEAEELARNIEDLFRRVSPDLPASADLVELRALQAQLCDLVKRAAADSSGAAAELTVLRTECGKNKEAAAKARADFLNYQKRASKDLAQAEADALRRYMCDMLPVLDGFDLAVADAKREKAEDSSVGAALHMLAQSLEQTLAVRGLKRMDATAQAFDPLLHEAVATRPCDQTAAEKPDCVAEILRSGWLWKDKILRPAQVLVTRAPKEALE
jgi:molecular chaperone GrpE